MTNSASAENAPRLRLWLTLSGAGLLGIAAASPYLSWSLQRMLELALPQQEGMPPFGVLLALQLVQALVMTTVFAGIGTWAAKRAGFQAPMFEALAAGRRPTFPRGFFVRAVLAGTAAWALIVVVALSFRPSLPASLTSAASEPDSLLVRLTGLFYGGIVEELWVRWALLSVIAVGLARVGVSRNTAGWGANVAAALLFGALHLPAAAGYTGGELTPVVIAYVLLGNAVGGLVFGWLFLSVGLEAAMVAHAVADVWLHGVQPLLPL